MRRAPFATRPFPRERHDIVDALEVGVRRHMVHALLELDVTRARQLIRDREAAAGERPSFTAFIVASLARALDADRRLQAYRDWRGRLVLFDEVDVVTLLESEVDAVAIPHVVRALRSDPNWLKRTAGTTLVTSVGMFGSGTGWAVGIVPLHTLGLTVGGITRTPGLVGDRVEAREYLAVTASIDHDVVDGAPAARFARRLRALVEGAEVLQDLAR